MLKGNDAQKIMLFLVLGILFIRFYRKKHARHT
jgi:hypothetical protein